MILKKTRNKKIVRMKKRGNRVAKIGGFLLLVVVTLLVLMLTPFFNIDWIDIKGNEKVSRGEIKSAISYNQGDNIFKLNLHRGEQNLTKIPYVETAKVKRKLPDGIRVAITERIPVAYLDENGIIILIDKDGRLLEQTDKAPENIPCLKGAIIEGLVLGQLIEDKSEESAKAFTVIYEKLNEYGLYDRVSELDITKTDAIEFSFDKNKRVVVGDGYRIDYKLMMLQAAIDELAPSEAGTIRLTVEGKAIFAPDKQE